MNMNWKDFAGKMLQKLKPYQHSIEVGAIALALILSIVALCSSPSRHRGSGKELPVQEAFDSLVAVLPKGSVVVARFPDQERADLYYLNSGVLYCFNGKSKLLEEMSIKGVPSGSYVSAKLTDDEKYIMLVVRQDKLDKLFRLNTMNRNIVDMEKSTAVPDDAKDEEQKPSQPAETAPEVPEITEPLPEAAFADEPTGTGHEVKKETPEPKKQADPANAPEVTTISTD